MAAKTTLTYFTATGYSTMGQAQSAEQSSPHDCGCSTCFKTSAASNAAAAVQPPQPTGDGDKSPAVGEEGRRGTVELRVSTASLAGSAEGCYPQVIHECGIYSYIRETSIEAPL